MDRIKFNPYIVGNPIKSREMFFGREDDFQFVARKIGEGRSNQIVVLCGERRSGKTSILFQILGGRLGDLFLPVLIDMQMLAGIKGDVEFFRAILRLGCAAAELPGEVLDAAAGGSGIEGLFELFLEGVNGKWPGKVVLFLLDEYELVEAKIRDGSLSESSIHYLAGILESPSRVSFVFTGSTNLEDRKVEVWKSLLAKSIYRKISYLSRNDTFRLIAEPLRDSVSYTPELMSAIYRLTGGQPFYTQVICQNMVDLLMEAERGDPGPQDLERIVREIVDNPLPQMIYSWNSVSEWDHVILAALAGRLADPEQWSDGRSILRFIRGSRILAPFRGPRVNVLLEDSYHREFLEKSDAETYRFKMDLFRRWIRREHSIWKAAKEAGLQFRKGGRVLAVAGAVAVVVVAAAALSWFLVRARAKPPDAAPPAALQAPAPLPEQAARKPLPRPARPKPPEAGPALPAGEPASAPRPMEEASPAALPPAEAEPPGPPAPEVSEPAAAVVEQPGILIITSQPSGCDVLIDGSPTGKKTPFAESLAAGEHEVSLEMEGFKPQSFAVSLEPGKQTSRGAVLEEATGWLIFDIRPTARLSLDGAYILDTPYAKRFPVRAGRHTLTIVNEALQVNKSIPIVVTEGTTQTIREVLK